MTCDECKWFVLDRPPTIGDCVAEPPRMGQRRWPQVYSHEFCGKFTAKEIALTFDQWMIDELKSLSGKLDSLSKEATNDT